MENVDNLYIAYEVSLIIVLVLSVFMIIWFKISDWVCDRSNEREYRESLYTTVKKELTVRQEIFILIEILIAGGLLVLARNTDFLDVVSVVSTVAGITCFQLYDFIIQNSKACSINFKYRMDHHKVCKFKYAPGWDSCMIVRNTLMAFLPFTIVFVAMSVIPYFYKVNDGLFLVLLALYSVCDLKSAYYIYTAKANIKVTICSVVQIFSFFIFFCMTWVFHTKVGVPKVFAWYAKIGCFLIVFAAISYLCLLMYLDCLWYKEIPYVIYPRVHKEKGNYFKIKMNDGKVFKSKKKFFYPISCKKGVQLLFEDSTSLILNKSDVESVLVCGVGDVAPYKIEKI